MLHHDRNFLASLDAERRRKAAERRLPTDNGELERIFIAASAGDQAAWSALTARFRAYLKRIARSHGVNANEAEDVAQETLLRLYKNMGRVSDARAIAAWVTTTARRESMRVAMGARRMQPTDADLGAELSAPDEFGDPFDLDVSSGPLQRALTKLPERHRQLVEMLLDEPAPTYSEITAKLGIPHGSIGPIRRRALEAIQRDLVQQGFVLVSD